MKSIEKQQNFESQEYGNDVTMHIKCIRHASKDIENELLTEQGKKDSYELGRQIASEKGDFKIYSSPHHRAQETSIAIKRGAVEELGDDSRYTTRNKIGLIADTFSEDFVRKINEVKKTNNNPEDEGNVIQFFIDAGKPDEETMSAAEVGIRAAEFFKKLIRMTERLKSGSEVTIVAVSHSGVIEPFLLEVLKRKYPQLKDNGFIEQIGGGYKFLEGFEIDIERKSKEEVRLVIHTRDENYEIEESDF